MKMGDSHYVPKPPQKSDGETQANRLSKSIIKTYLNQKASDFISVFNMMISTCIIFSAGRKW